jgi:HK97 family phage major capsid protein
MKRAKPNPIEGIRYLDAPPSLRERIETLDRPGIRAIVEEIIEKSRTLPTTVITREMVIERMTINEDERTLELSFSSEFPVLRWFGWEILDHSLGSVRLDRLKENGPVVTDHNGRGETHIGTVEKVWIGDRKGRALVRFSRAPFAELVFRDVLDGIRKSVSVAYIIHEMVPEGVIDDEPIFRAIDWEPRHVSFVSEPADGQVGPGRGLLGDGEEEIEIPTAIGERAKQHARAPAAPSTKPDRSRTMPENTRILDERTPAQISAERDERMAAVRAEAKKTEGSRLRTIHGLGQKYADRWAGAPAAAQEFIDDEKTIDEFRALLLERIGTNEPTAISDSVDDARIGLTEREARQFSFCRLILALANPSDRKAREAAAFELECSEAVAGRYGAPEGAYIPVEAMNAPLVDLRGSSSWAFRKRQQLERIITTAGAGVGMIPTDHLGDSFIDLLKSRGVAFQNATILRDLTGNVDIPRLSTGSVAAWAAEAGAVAASTPVTNKLTLVPNTIGVLVEVTRRQLIQSSPDIELIIRNDMAFRVTEGIDTAALQGTGGTQPTGISGTAGIGAVTDAGDPWAEVIEMETDVSVANADVVDMAYACNAKTRGYLKSFLKDAGIGGYVWESDNTINGYRTIVSNLLPSTLGTGSDNRVLFGNWKDLIVALFGPMDIVVNREDGSGDIHTTVLMEADVGLRHPESFSMMADLTI